MVFEHQNYIENVHSEAFSKHIHKYSDELI